MYHVNELLMEAVSEVNHLENEEVFLVKDLFKGYIWNRIAIKDRLLLGTLFLNYVHSEDCNIDAIEKTSSHQQLYKKQTNCSS